MSYLNPKSSFCKADIKDKPWTKVDFIKILINRWPYKSLIISKFLANMFTSLVFLYSDSEMGHRTRLGKNNINKNVCAIRAYGYKTKFDDLFKVVIRVFYKNFSNYIWYSELKMILGCLRLMQRTCFWMLLRGFWFS